MDHKEPLVTVITKIKLKPDTKNWRPYVTLKGLKSTNSVTLITDSDIRSRWKLMNNVLPQVPVARGQDITANIKEGRRGKPVTEEMRSPGAVRKKIKKDQDETDPKIVESQFRYRTKFIKKGRLEYYLKHQLNIII